jgi:hypothetical protein
MRSLCLSKTKLRRIAKEILELCPDYMGYPHMSKSVYIMPRLSIHYHGSDAWMGEFENEDLIIRIFPYRIKSKLELVRTIIHEYTHYVQMYNSPRMERRYLELNESFGYKNNPLEIEARENELKYMRLVYARVKHLF